MLAQGVGLLLDDGELLRDRVLRADNEVCHQDNEAAQVRDGLLQQLAWWVFLMRKWLLSMRCKGFINNIMMPWKLPKFVIVMSDNLLGGFTQYENKNGILLVRSGGFAGSM